MNCMSKNNPPNNGDENKTGRGRVIKCSALSLRCRPSEFANLIGEKVVREGDEVKVIENLGVWSKVETSKETVAFVLTEKLAID